MSSLYYEQKQNRNALTRFLHSGRYNSLVDFAKKNFSSQKIRVLDIGCGPGGAYKHLSEHFQIDYFGVDVREDFIEAAQERYEKEHFAVADVTDESFDFEGYDFIIALETFEHIPEGKLVRVIERISQARPKFHFCSVPIEIGPSIAIKNFGSQLMGYDRRSGNFLETVYAATYNLNRLPPHGTDHLGFNWIWLEQTLRHNMEIVHSASLPYGWLPKMIAPSVSFICKPYP